MKLKTVQYYLSVRSVISFIHSLITCWLSFISILRPEIDKYKQSTRSGKTDSNWLITKTFINGQNESWKINEFQMEKLNKLQSLQGGESIESNPLWIWYIFVYNIRSEKEQESYRKNRLRCDLGGHIARWWKEIRNTSSVSKLIMKFWPRTERPTSKWRSTWWKWNTS